MKVGLITFSPDFKSDFSEWLDRLEPNPSVLPNTPEVLKRMGESWLKHYRRLANKAKE